MWLLLLSLTHGNQDSFHVEEALGQSAAVGLVEHWPELCLRTSAGQVERACRAEAGSMEMRSSVHL